MWIRKERKELELQLKCRSNMENLLEGFKDPEEIIISASDIKLPTYIQMSGRCYRSNLKKYQIELTESLKKSFGDNCNIYCTFDTGVGKTYLFWMCREMRKQFKLAFNLKYWMKFWFFIVLGYLSIIAICLYIQK